MPSRYAIYVLALMFGINFLNYMDPFDNRGACAADRVLDETLENRGSLCGGPRPSRDARG